MCDDMYYLENILLKPFITLHELTVPIIQIKYDLKIDHNAPLRPKLKQGCVMQRLPTAQVVGPDILTVYTTLITAIYRTRLINKHQPDPRRATSLASKGPVYPGCIAVIFDVVMCCSGS